MNNSMLRRTRSGPLLLVALVCATRSAAQSPVTVPPRPNIGEAKPFVFPKINTQTLPNGLRLAVIENHELPLVAVRVGLLGGSSLDAPGKEGGWALMLSSLGEGTMMRSSASIAEAAADLGTVISWDAGSPSFGAPRFVTIKSAWQPALQLVAEMLMYPSFPSDAVSRLQAAQVNALVRPAQGTLPLRLISRALYGPEHVYTRVAQATDSSVRRVTHEDIVALHAAYVRPQNAIIVVSGDVTPAEARVAVERTFGSWQRTEKIVESKYLPSATTERAPTTIYLRDFPGAAQAFLMTGSALPSRGSADAPAIEAVDAIIGGSSAGSRMFDAFRGTRGLAYSIPSAIQWRPEPQAAHWLVVAIVPVDKADTAMVQMVRVLRETHGDRPITQAELDFSRRNLVGSLPLQLETVDALASSALGALRNGLPVTFNNDRVSRLNSLTLAEVQAAAAKYIDPEHLILAVVGDRAKLEAPLRATGIPVVIIDR